jgi:hypothetical protein
MKDRAVRLAIVAAFAALLTATAVTPAAAQPGTERAARPQATVDASVPEATSPTTPRPGPRLRPEWPRVEPASAEHRDSAEPMPPAGNSHTIVLSTLALVVIVVIATILVVK